MKPVKIATLLILMVIGTEMRSQDIHFSQFYMSPLNLNPAMTGVMNCKNRFIVNYRNQWAGVLKGNAFNTYSASYDQKTPLGREDYFGIGGTLWGDVAGASRFGSTQGRLSLSYSKKMGGYRKKASYLVLGADAGLTQRRIDPADLLWPAQIKGGPPELIKNESFLYPDIAAGLLWFSIVDNHTNWYLGAAIHHLNQPSVSFLGNSTSVATLYSKYTIHAGAQFEIAPKMSVLPFGVFMSQGPHREFNAGASLRFAMGPSRISNQSFDIGLWYRLGVQDSSPDNEVKTSLHSDAIILASRFNYEHFGIGFSYDLNISKLASASPGNGSFEFSLTYDICGPESRGVYCPRF